MERGRHFLDDVVDELRETEFYKSLPDEPEPWYNEAGDCLEYAATHDEYIGDRVNQYLTVYRALDDRRAVGFKIKGIRGLMEEFDADGAGLEGVIKHNREGGISAFIFFWLAINRTPTEELQTSNQQSSTERKIERLVLCKDLMIELMPVWPEHDKVLIPV